MHALTYVCTINLSSQMERTDSILQVYHFAYQKISVDLSFRPKTTFTIFAKFYLGGFYTFSTLFPVLDLMGSSLHMFRVLPHWTITRHDILHSRIILGPIRPMLIPTSTLLLLYYFIKHQAKK